MSKEMSVIVLGIWIIVVPYLGVPSSWRTMLLVLSGLAVAIIGFLLRSESLGRPQATLQVRRRAEDSFVESTPAPQEGRDTSGLGSLN